MRICKESREEINLLTKDKALSESQIKRQKFARNAFASGLVLVFLIALLIFRNYREKVKTNKILDEQKDQIEHLLLNILPSEVAKELQFSGHATQEIMIRLLLCLPILKASLLTPINYHQENW